VRADSDRLFHIAAVVGPLLFLSQSKRGGADCESVDRVRVGAVEEFPEGGMREVPIGTVDDSGKGPKVLIHRHGGKFYATSPTCCHYGAPLSKGVTASGGKPGIGPTVTCALHDATFDLSTGDVVRGPGLDGIATYKVDVVDGHVVVQIPRSIASGGSKHAVWTKKAAKRDAKDLRVFAIVGGGAAAMAAAETLRAEGFTGRIVLLSKEEHLPYDRVQLSKTLEKPVEKLTLRPAGFYKDRDIDIIHGAVVSKVQAAERSLQYRVGADPVQTLQYDKVLIASGGSPRKLFVPGSELQNIFTLRTPEDAAEIAKVAKSGHKIVVVGGSFIGMEIASTLRKKGCDVAIVAMETVPFERVLGKKIGASFAQLIQKEGVQWIGSSQVRNFRGQVAVNGVELEDGEVLAADGVVIGAGVLPNTRFLEGTPLDKNGAIVVGPLLNSSTQPTLFAAGDVCTYPSLRTGNQVRIEHWDVALQQGRIAAKNMLDQYHPFTTIPFFWSSLFGKNLRFVGHAPEFLDRVLVEGSASQMEFISYYVEGDEIRAVATVNRDPLAAACAELMRRGMMPKVSEVMVGAVNGDVIMERLRLLGTLPQRS